MRMGSHHVMLRLREDCWSGIHSFFQRSRHKPEAVKVLREDGGQVDRHVGFRNCDLGSIRTSPWPQFVLQLIVIV